MNTTTAPNQATDPIAHAHKAPDVAALLAEFQRIAPMAAGGWNPLTNNDDVRFNRWTGKQTDGKKHNDKDKEAFPFDGASDAEDYLTDDLINSLVAREFEAFWRAWLLPKYGVSEESGYALKLADHLVNTALYEQLYTAVELSGQYRQHYGWCALQPTWVREVALENKTITFKDVENFATETPGFEQLPQMLLDPTLDDQSVEVLHALYRDYTQGLVKRVGTFRAVELDGATLRRAVQELREDQKTELPVPYICRDEPTILARKPLDEIFLSGDTVDLQQRRFYLRCWEDEVTLRAKQNTHGWSKAFVDEALKHKGVRSVWGSTTTGVNGGPPTALSAAMTQTATTAWTEQDSKDGLVEMLYCVYRALDKNNVPGVYMTALCPHVKAPDKGTDAQPLYAWHGLLAGAKGRIPLIIGTRERVAANIGASRGVPQIAGSWQRQKKVQHDGLTDWTSVSVFPPINEYTSNYGTKFKFGPGVRNRYTNKGKEAEFMQIPSGGVPVSMEMVHELSREARDYMGLPTPENPNGDPSKLQKDIGSFLLMWSAAIQELLNLCQANMDDAEFALITGAPEGWLEENRNNPRAFGAKLQFDVRELQPDFVLKQLDVINKTIVPGDVSGAIDRNDLTRWQMRIVNPMAARHLIADKSAASQKMFNDVKNDLAQMFLGNEPQYVENDPAANTKLQYATQIVQANPTYQQALQSEGRFGQLMMKYTMNLQFSITQDKNKQVGRIGVTPGEA